jgi:uncharacterized protein involved in exopolysaccharide biosynthesis
MNEFEFGNGRRSGNSLYDALYNQRTVVTVVILLGLALAAALILLAKPKYTATATLLMVAESANSLGPAAKPLLATDLPALATSETVLERFRHDIGADVTYDALKTRIRAKVAGDSNIMPVEYTDHTVDGAIRGANLLADDVEAFYRELATKRFDSLIADLQRQTAAHARRLSHLDAAIEAAAKQYPYVDVSPTTTIEQSVYQRLVSLRTERDELLSTVAADKAAASEAQQLVSDAQAPAMRDVVNNDAPYRDLRDQYARDLAQLQRVESYGSASYPGLKELQTIVAREGAGLARARLAAAAAGPGSNLAYATARDAVAKTEAQLQSDASKANVLDSQIAALNEQIGKSGIAVKVAGLRRDRENEQTAYSTLAARLASTVADRAEAASTGSVSVIDRASSASRAVFTTSTYLAAAIVFITLWLAVSLALLRENKKDRFEENEDVIRGIYEAPLVGSL